MISTSAHAKCVRKQRQANDLNHKQTRKFQYFHFLLFTWWIIILNFHPNNYLYVLFMVEITIFISKLVAQKINNLIDHPTRFFIVILKLLESTANILALRLEKDQQTLWSAKNSLLLAKRALKVPLEAACGPKWILSLLFFLALHLLSALSIIAMRLLLPSPPASELAHATRCVCFPKQWLVFQGGSKQRRNSLK